MQPTTTATSKKDIIKPCLVALLGLWLSTIIFHAIFTSPYYNVDITALDTLAPAKIFIACLDKSSSNSTIPIPLAEPCLLEYAAVKDPWNMNDHISLLGFVNSIIWLVSLMMTLGFLYDLLPGEEPFQVIFAALGSGVLGLLWVLFEPFGWEERNVKGYMEGFIVPVLLVVTLAVGRAAWCTYQPVTQTEGAEEMDGRQAVAQERRNGDLESGTVSGR